MSSPESSAATAVVLDAPLRAQALALARAVAGPAASFAFAATVLVPCALLRLVDGDEGYLLLAARMVREGAVPYRDFFFPQPPLAAYVFAHGSLAASPWYGARALCALLAAGTAAMLHATLRRRGLRASRCFGAACAFACSPLVIAWATPAKTLALATALLYATHALAAGAVARAPRLRGVLLGLCAVAAVATRINLLAIAPLIVLGAIRRERDRLFEMSIATGALAATTPLSALFAVAPREAWFGIVRYHLGRADLAGLAALRQKLEVLKQALGFGLAERWLGLAHLLLVVVAALGARHRWRRARAIRPAAKTWALLTLVSLAATPTFVQYLVVGVPFLVELAASDGVDALAGVARDASRRARTLAVALAGVVMLGCAGAEGFRHLVTGRRVIGVRAPEEAARWRIPAVRAIGAAVALRAGDGCVLSAWPGYLVDGGARPCPGTEDHFARQAATRVDSAALRARLHLAGPAEIEGMLRRREAAWAIEGLGIDWSLSAGELRAHGYVPREVLADGITVLWRAP